MKIHRAQQNPHGLQHIYGLQHSCNFFTICNTAATLPATRCKLQHICNNRVQWLQHTIPCNTGRSIVCNTRLPATLAAALSATRHCLQHDLR